MVAIAQMGAGGKMLSGAVHCVDIIVTIVKEIPHLLPWLRVQPGGALPQRFVERGEAVLPVAIGAVQVEKGARQGRGVGGGELQIRQRRGLAK